MEYILQTDNLSKVYGTKTVLNHVSIHVPKKSIYGLVGKNGAGKTTLMRIICGLTQQSEGSYTLLGKSNDDAARNNMGVLIEKPGIYEHMTALENLRYFSLLFGLQSQDHHKILEMVGLQNAGKKKARQFSLGMKQRLGIAISLLGNPDFLILDEPINGLDPEGVYEMRKMLATLNREHGTTIMIASHILSELHKLATDYAIIDGGCLIDEFNRFLCFIEGQNTNLFLWKIHQQQHNLSVVVRRSAQVLPRLGAYRLIDCALRAADQDKPVLADWMAAAEQLFGFV